MMEFPRGALCALVLLTAARAQAAGDEFLCAAGDSMRFVSARGVAGAEFKPAPPAPLTMFTVAGKSIVGIAAGNVYQLRGGKWSQLDLPRRPGQADPLEREPLRIEARARDVIIYLRGADPGTIEGALRITPAGKVTKLSFAQARALGPIWQATGGRAKEPRGDCPALVNALKVNDSEGATCELLFDEPSPWGGRLVAARGQSEGDWPGGPLIHLAGGRATILKYKDQPLDFRGVLGYARGGELLFDGRYSAEGSGVLVVRPQGSKGYSVALLAGAPGPCAVWARN